MMLMASVPMKELIRVRWMATPLAMPRPSPAATAATRPTVGDVESATFVAVTPVTLTIAPTERSKTPARMQIVSPIVSSPSGPHWSSRLERFPVVRK